MPFPAAQPSSSVTPVRSGSSLTGLDADKGRGTSFYVDAAVGKELRDGRIELRDVLGVGAYREKVERGFAENQEAVAQTKEQLEREAERRDRDR